MTDERCEKACSLRDEGKTYKEIGDILGKIDNPKNPISATRARQLVHKGFRLRRKVGHPDDIYQAGALSVKTRHILESIYIYTKKDCVSALENGAIKIGLRNFGKKTIDEICAWCGFKKENVKRSESQENHIKNTVKYLQQNGYFVFRESSKQDIYPGIAVEGDIPKFIVYQGSGDERRAMINTSIFHQISKYIVGQEWVGQISASILSSGPGEKDVAKLKDLRKTLNELVILADQHIEQIDQKRTSSSDVGIGYYWYYPGQDESFGDVVLVEVIRGQTVCFLGSDFSIGAQKLTGEFVGPILPTRGRYRA